jgi:hypothetical protein
MSYVWDGYPGSGSELLAMLAMADWCDDKGGSLYPSMKAVWTSPASVDIFQLPVRSCSNASGLSWSR